MKTIPLAIVLVTLLVVAALPATAQSSILNSSNTIQTVSTTVPANGNVNPYGIVVEPTTTGKLTKGHFLISNFNNSTNAQGTGTTIVDISPKGDLTLFAQINPAALPGPCPGGVGLTTALAVTDSGWVIVGSLPTSDGTSATAQAGCLIVLDKNGNAVETFYGSLINGPWDMAWVGRPCQTILFVTNVLNGTVAANGTVVNGGTVVRIVLDQLATMMPALESMTVVGSGFAERTDPAALVLGPTGVAVSSSSEPVLYVADTLNNRITVIPNPLTRTTSAGTGETLTSGGSLNAPLGLIAAPNGDLVTVNGADGYGTLISSFGTQIEKQLLDSSGSPAGAGALFGLVLGADGLYFVDDATNTLNLLH